MLVTEEGSDGHKKTTLLGRRGLDEKLLGERVFQDSLKEESVSTFLALIAARFLNGARIFSPGKRAEKSM